MSESERIAAIRRGNRKTERRAKRYAAIIRRAVAIIDRLTDELDSLANELEQEVEKR